MSTFNRSGQRNFTVAFTVTRDRKLRVWDLGSDACIRVIDLPGMLDSTSGDEEQRRMTVHDPSTNEEGSSSSVNVFSTAPLVRTYEAADTLYILVYIPAPLPSGNFIVCYQVHFAGTSVGQIGLVWAKRCDKESLGWNVELRDLVVVPQSDQQWSVWGLWDAAGRTYVKYTSGTDADGPWNSVSMPQSYSSLHGLSLDEDLKAVLRAEDMAEFFMRRIVEPGRFSQGSLEGALRQYEALLGVGHAMPPSSVDSIREQICALVGSNAVLEEEQASGMLLHDRYWAELRREWATFVNLVEDQEAAERWPIRFQQGKDGADEPYVVSRGRLSLPIAEDPSSTLLRRVRQGTAEGDGLDAAVMDVLEVASKLLHAIHPPSLHNFETELLRMLETQSSTPPENIADLLWTAHVQRSLEDEDMLGEAFANLVDFDVKQVVMDVLALLQHSSTTNTSESTSRMLTELDAALCSDAITQVSSDRLALARSLNVFVFALYVGYLSLEESLVENLDGGATIEVVVGDVMATYHRLYAFDALARRDGTVETVDREPSRDDLGDADANTVAEEMGNLQFGGDEGELIETGASASNLVHACILRRRLGRDIAVSATSLQDRVYQFSILALQDLLFPPGGQSLQPINLPASLALFAHDIVTIGHPLAAATFVQLFPRTPAADYLIARGLVLSSKVEEAAAAFDRVVPAFYRLEEERSAYGSGLMDMVSRPIKGAKTTPDALFYYYRRVVSYFQQRPAQSHFFVARFAKKALDVATSGSHGDMRTLQELRFHSLLALEWYEDAYSHLLAIPHLDEQKRLLPDLISRMSEQGHVDLLLSLNFASLQLEVSSTLSFKARNSKSLEEIDFYFNLLYAFYVKRGDFKNAGATMWQMGTRLRHTAKVAQAGRGCDDEEMRHLSILEARCYLASINVLSQLDAHDAWFAHETGGAEDEEGMQSRLTSYVPTASFHGKSRDSLRIVTLQDIRRRYQVRLAQLELFSTHPLYSASILTTDRNDAINVVSLFAGNDDFERAFTLARLLNVDRTHVFSVLTDRCLEQTQWEEERKKRIEVGDTEHPLIQTLLDDQEGQSHGGEDSRHDQASGFLSRIDRCTTWTGSSTHRAWKYLRLWLDMEGDDKGADQSTVAKYHLVVLDRILHWQRFSSSPAWLLDWLRQNEAELFVKSLVRHELLDPALRESLQMVTATTAVVTKKRKRGGLASQVYLPYLLLDELLKRSEDAPASQETASGDGALIERRKLAKRLGDAIDAHKQQLQAVEAQTRRERDEDERQERRYDARQEDVAMGTN